MLWASKAAACCCCKRVKESGGVGNTEGERELERGLFFRLNGVCGSATSLEGEYESKK
jgi:hypothetical protein